MNDVSNKIQQLLAEKFRTVTSGRLERLSLTLLAIESRTADAAQIEECQRDLHTLKGEAKLVGFLEISEVAHAMEDLLLFAQERDFKVETALFDLLLAGLDGIASLLRPGEQSFTAQDFRNSVQKTIETSTPVELDRLEATGAGDAVGMEPIAGSGIEPGSIFDRVRKSRANQQVSLETDRLDELTTTLGVLLQNHAQGQHAGRKSARLLAEVASSSRSSLAEARRLASQIGAGPVFIKLISELEALQQKNDQLRLLGAGLRNLTFERGLHLEQIAARLRDLRLVPLAQLFNVLPRPIRDLARELGKEVEVKISGEQVTVDQKIHQAIKDPLLHLVRNSVDHALEAPDERVAVGKRREAEIEIAAERRGAFVVVSIRDDGRGIDPSFLRQRAVSRGWLKAEDAEALSDRQVLDLLFRSGFSTRDEVSLVSGRGIGLDVVRTSVESLGGSVLIDSVPGQGTTFQLILPSELAFQELLLLRQGATVFAVPAASVARILRLSAHQIKRAGGGRVFDFETEILPLFDLAAILGAEVETGPEECEVLVIDHGARRVGFVVSRVLGQEALVSRNLDEFLRDHFLVAGTAVRGDGQLVLILNLAELVATRAIGERVRPAPAATAARDESHKGALLIVEDSDLTRTMLCTILAFRGHATLEAGNGREALDLLAREHVDLMLIDLDMPVMNGFELLAARQGDPKFGHIPAIVFSSRGSSEDKRRCLELGADAFLVKSDFAEEIFTETIERFLPH